MAVGSIAVPFLKPAMTVKTKYFLIILIVGISVLQDIIAIPMFKLKNKILTSIEINKY